MDTRFNSIAIQPTRFISKDRGYRFIIGLKRGSLYLNE